MSLYKTEAIVLRRRDFRETSLIVDFYTLDFGKISGLVKGARQDPQKFASALEPFSYNEIIFYKKKNSALHLISQCDLRDNFNGLRQDIAKVGSACVMAELLAAVVPVEEKNKEIFKLFLTCLKELEINSNSTNKIATIFKIKILSLSGFRPHLDSCVSCQIKILGEAKFSLVLGGLLCTKCAKKDLQARSIFRGTVATILYIEKNDLKHNLNLGMNPQIKRELDLILRAFLVFHLEKDFKAQRVLDNLSHRIRGGSLSLVGKTEDHP